MPRFFVEGCRAHPGQTIIVDGEDAKHISLALRSKVGEKFTVCDTNGTDYMCTVAKITQKTVELVVNSEENSKSEPDVFVTLYQALVKSDKFDTVVQKSVELGVSRIVPVVTSRCISRPDAQSGAKKVERWNKISKEAAMQSGRGIIPTVEGIVTYDKALGRIANADCGFVCYETQPHIPVFDILSKACKSTKPQSIAFFVGPEGGIDPKEAAMAQEKGIKLASLGNRILRAETAPVCVLSAVMYATENLG